jgi:SAM-dependent methyltransferase
MGTPNATQAALPATGTAVPPGGLPVYASAIFLSAFLLFLVQPIIAKAILPWFGGAASVWAVSMLFFQAVLLLGYLYTYLVVRLLSAGWQAALHVLLLAASALLLPLAPGQGWKPAGGEDPALRILGLLGVSAGLPYFLLSTTGPLLQAWYAASRKAVIPYRLFALSNLGSLLALLLYPAVIEPLATTRGQLRAWSWAYGAFLAVCGAAALMSWRTNGSAGWGETAGEQEPAPPTAAGQILWVALAACASTLLLAVTNHLCQDVAAIPLLWIVPLAVYLLSFILCFDRAGWYSLTVFRWLMPLTLAGLGFSLFRASTLPPLVAIPLFAAGLFVCAMFCHGELARRKPHSRHLTSFYLSIALGGALGGLFVGFAAPRLLNGPLEFPIGVAGCAVLALFCLYGRSSPGVLLRAGLAITLALVLSVKVRVWTSGVYPAGRNFYGTLSLGNFEPDDRSRAALFLYHGSIIHGVQLLSPSRIDEPTSYYGRGSGVEMVLKRRQGARRRIGVVGLGVGTLAAYGKPGDYFRFYEINPLVVQLASSRFAFLKRSEARVDVVLGDGRLSLEREPAQAFDVLVIDAFSSDSIPVHLLTREAFAQYFRHLNEDGVLAVHITNRHVDLAPLLGRVGEVFGKRTHVLSSGPDRSRHVFGARWFVFDGRAESMARPDAGIWTDDYSNLLAVLK